LSWIFCFTFCVESVASELHSLHMLQCHDIPPAHNLSDVATRVKATPNHACKVHTPKSNANALIYIKIKHTARSGVRTTMHERQGSAKEPATPACQHAKHYSVATQSCSALTSIVSLGSTSSVMVLPVSVFTKICMLADID